MTDEELQKLDHQLAQEEQNIIQQLGEVSAPNPSVRGDFEPVMPNYEGNDEDERINEASDFDRNLAMEQQLETRLKDIRDVRGKIKSGTYGVCSNCENAIPENRLKAMPSASLCIACAQQS
jgi:DnaK suppressor protein